MLDALKYRGKAIAFSSNGCWPRTIRTRSLRSCRRGNSLGPCPGPNARHVRPAMSKIFNEDNVRRAFEISLILKGFFALLEVAGGIAAYFVTQNFLLNLVTAITQNELRQDPDDLVANFLLQTAQGFSISTQRFTALYLLSHGATKLFVIVGLLRRKLWYYPLAIVLFGLFVAYQLYRFSFTHSVWLLVITLLDLLVIVLTWHEYNFMRKHRSAIS
jgi:uncharacterized membrane protein